MNSPASVARNPTASETISPPCTSAGSISALNPGAVLSQHEPGRPVPCRDVGEQDEHRRDDGQQYPEDRVTAPVSPRHPHGADQLIDCRTRTRPELLAAGDPAGGRDDGEGDDDRTHGPDQPNPSRRYARRAGTAGRPSTARRSGSASRAGRTGSSRVRDPARHRASRIAPIASLSCTPRSAESAPGAKGERLSWSPTRLTETS